jgi:hypothetical protein
MRNTIEGLICYSTDPEAGFEIWSRANHAMTDHLEDSLAGHAVACRAENEHGLFVWL